MANLLKNIKGRFLLSINDSPNVRKIFKNFDITMLKVRGAAIRKTNLKRHQNTDKCKSFQTTISCSP
jgi:hypothetical protein